jgi:hypothetical protein
MVTGCLDMETVINVEKDGSGTVEQTFLMQKDMVMMMQSMSEEQNGGEFALLDREELENNAAGMGEGVTLVSAEPLEREGFQGYKAVYSFTDINELEVNQNPGGKVPDTGPEQEPEVEENLTFSFQRGTPSVLEVMFPKKEDLTAQSEDSDGQERRMPGEEEIEMMKQIYEKMRVAIKLTVDGTIRKTNATYRDGSTLTLMEIEFGKLFEDRETIERLTEREPGSLEAMKSLVNEIPGIKVELNDTINVAFD